MRFLQNPVLRMLLVATVTLGVCVPIYIYFLGPSDLTVLGILLDPWTWISIGVGVFFVVSGFWVSRRGG